MQTAPFLALLVFAVVAHAQPDKTDPKAAKVDPKTETKTETKESPKVSAKPSIPEAITTGINLVLSMQEDFGKGGKPEDLAEWPYEGVYRVNGEIPIGYRIGGTAICATAIVLAPGYADDDKKHTAVARAVAFVIKGIEHPLMSPDYDGGYDVRGWGYTYGLRFLLLLKSNKLLPEDQSAAAEKAIRFFIDALKETQIPQVGGWNYARPAGKEKVAPPSPFMTAPTLQALFEAKAQGYEIDAEVVEKGLKYLESSREASGAVVYSGDAGSKKDGVPGAVGRMLATESVLYLAGRSSQANIRAAIDAFIVHWQWLDKRRAQNGTHVAPYMIAPYYFYYAHYHAAQAIELLPAHERAEYRRRVNDLLFSVRLDDGTWNDRVFKRSANFGTAFASMALMMPDLPKPVGWKN